ncbi:unnamed protein product [Blepharisma stoltei]|uniref:SAPS-domain-containing protein n=1 Tax=Blepharisma stoltei TaxID=1481888 RepID=A0AAU9ILT5_9CILI|nr:unnamed protein product [Blepharisma stoltei]
MIMNFGSLLNSFKFLQDSELIDSLLTKEGLKLEEILDTNEEAIIELKKGNQKLIGFLVPSHLGELIDYTTLDPIDTNNQNQCYKYPFVSNEILNSECPDLLNAIFADTTLLDRLFKFLSADLPNNPILAGYFSRTLHSLLVKNSYALLSYLYDTNGHGKALARHLYSKSISDILERILTCETHTNPVFKPKLYEIIGLILENISSTNSPEAVINSSSLLASLVTKKQGISCALEASEYLWGNEKNVKFLFSKLLNEEFHISRSVSLIIQALINALLEKENDEESMAEDDVIPMIEFMINNFDHFTEVLKKQSNVPFTFPNKIEFIPLGELRLRIIEILGSVVRLSNEKLKDKIAESLAIPIITELFAEYHWNSFLHNSYEKLVQNILLSGHSGLKDALIRKSNLPQILIKFSQSGIENRIGLMGHVTRIGNILLKHFSKDENPPNEDWIYFANNYLSFQNEIESRVLGGRSRIMSFDLTDHYMDTNDDRNKEDAFEDIDYNYEKQNNSPIEEQDIDNLRREPENSYMKNNWQIENAQRLEELD